MSKINLKTDYEDGNILHGDELNINNNVTMLGVNDNFERINDLGIKKADITYVDNVVSSKADLSLLNTRIANLDATKADKTALAAKANQSDVDLKANQSYVDNQLSFKANQSYVEAQLNSKVGIDNYNIDLSLKADKSTIGNLNNLKTEDKSSIVNAINSINTDAKAIATTETAGIVKPDGTTITIDQDGTIHSLGGGGGTGTGDYNDLANKPQINDVEIKGNVSLEDLGLESSEVIDEKIAAKANITDVYSKTYIDTNVIAPLETKVDTSALNAAVSPKANSADVYTKTAINELISGVESSFQTLLEPKANAVDVYTKNEADNKIDTKADNIKFENEQLQLTSGGENVGDPVTLHLTGTEVVISEEQPIGDDWKIWIPDNQAEQLSEVVDSLDGNATNVAPSVRAIKEAICYSTSEHFTGKHWIDGKPIYSKTYAGTLSSSSNNTILPAIANLDLVIHQYGNIKTGGNYQIPIPAYTTSTNYTNLSVNETNQPYIGVSDNYKGRTYMLVVEYTKTTDNAVSLLSEVEE